ncbi:hypothetical protein BGZ73_003930 [Actinomortierella ambigua]|nr:hypothetical protein BGZ73_003930 [Actinomortierella ambigua]
MTSLGHGSSSGTHPKRQRISLRRPTTRQSAAAAVTTTSPAHDNQQEDQHAQQQQSIAGISNAHANNKRPETSDNKPHSKEEHRQRPQRSLIDRITSAALSTAADTKKNTIPPQSVSSSQSTIQPSITTTTATTDSFMARSDLCMEQEGADTVAHEKSHQLASQTPQPADTVSRGDHAATFTVVATSATNLASAATKSPPANKPTTRSALAGTKRKFAHTLKGNENAVSKSMTSALPGQSPALDGDSSSRKVDDSETQVDPRGATTLMDTNKIVDEIEDWSEEDLKALQELETQPKTSIPDNACPVCGIDLLSLNDVTPEGHVNRCLDNPSSSSTSSGMLIDTPTSTNGSASFVRSGSLVSSVTAILGSVQQAVVATATSSFSTISSTVLATTTTVATKATTSTPSTAASGKATKKPMRPPRPPKPCPFYKKMPDTTFTVDAFSYGCIPDCTGYFLSHFHSDHYGGLTSTWKHGLIYCSSITANLVLSRLKVDPQYVRRLPMYEPTVIDGVTVRLLDANHCPGSVLFVFDLPATSTWPHQQRRYLHTGDFRAHPSMISHPILRQPDNPPIDILYLDTTYINPKYTFPPQDAVIEATAQMVAKELGVVDQAASASAVDSSGLTSRKPMAAAPPKKKSSSIMESWLKRMDGNSEKLQGMKASKQQSSSSSVRSNGSSNTSSSLSIWGTQRGSRGPTRYPGTWPDQVDGSKVLVCVGTYLIGKERVFMAIAKAIGSKVFVQPAKRQILDCLEDPVLIAMLTDDPLEAQVHLVHMGADLGPPALQTYLESLQPRFERVIAIRPTGWSFSPSKKSGPDSADAAPPPLSSSSSSPSPSLGMTTAQSGSVGTASDHLDHPPVVLKPSYVSEKLKIFGVPYSEHSSFSELAGFVRSLQIAKVIPTVGVGTEKGRLTMRAWFDRWARERERGIRWRVVESGADDDEEHEREMLSAQDEAGQSENGMLAMAAASACSSASSSSSSSTSGNTPLPNEDSPVQCELEDPPLLPEELEL